MKLKESSIQLLVGLIVMNLFATATILAQESAPVINSPEVLPDNSVVFRFKAPCDEGIQVLGTWPTSYEYTIPMEKKDSIFEVKVGPLPAGMYEYNFLIGDVRVLDPNNNAVTRDGDWIQNRLMVPGEAADLYDVKPVPHGHVTAQWYTSPTLGSDRRMYVYTPPGYQDSTEDYPVLYLLHGGGGDEDGWVSRGRANYLLDNLIAQDLAAPMIVVITNGDVKNVAAPLDEPYGKIEKDQTGIGAMASKKFEKSLVNDVIPYIESHYRVKSGAENRAITGFSMGGYQTQNITNAHPEMFDYISVMSMGLFSSYGNGADYDLEAHKAQLKKVKESDPEVYLVFMGTKDFLYQTVLELNKLYDEVGLNYTYIEDDGRHDWYSWRKYLADFVPRLFKE